MYKQIGKRTELSFDGCPDSLPLGDVDEGKGGRDNDYSQVMVEIEFGC